MSIRALMSVHVLALGLLLAPTAAHAQLAAPGLGLNRPDLYDEWWDLDGPLGYPVGVKGAPKTSGGLPALDGFLRGAVHPNVDTGGASGTTPPWQTAYDGPVSISSLGLSQTLVPPYASGVVMAAASTGPGIQAMLFEPDDVKRKLTKKGSSTQLKQKDQVGFRFLNKTSPSSYSPYPRFTASGCKAQVKFETALDWNSGRGRMKVKCSNKSDNAEDVLGRLEEIFGKKRSGFDLDQKWD
jgi:hypothetical protein